MISCLLPTVTDLVITDEGRDVSKHSCSFYIF